MQFKVLAIAAALSAGALAQLEERQMVTDSVGASVLMVLATAIPPESISIATADPAAFSAELASSMSAGNTPEWYQALPSDVKSLLPKLYPASAAAETTGASTAASTPVSTPATTPLVQPISTGATISGTPVGGNSTAIDTVSSATLASTGGANSDAPSSAGTTGADATGGASYPTAVVGAGVAGALGFLGMLAM